MRCSLTSWSYFVLTTMTGICTSVSVRGGKAREIRINLTFLSQREELLVSSLLQPHPRTGSECSAFHTNCQISREFTLTAEYVPDGMYFVSQLHPTSVAQKRLHSIPIVRGSCFETLAIVEDKSCVLRRLVFPIYVCYASAIVRNVNFLRRLSCHCRNEAGRALTLRLMLKIL